MEHSQPMVQQEVMKKCKYCKMEVPTDAQICPHCRKRLITSTTTKIVAGFFIFIFGLSFLGGLFHGDNAISSVTKTPTLSQKDTQQIGADVDAWKKTPAGKLCVQHDTWTRFDCDLVIAHKIAVGMSYSALVYTRGKPDDVNVSNYGSTNQYQYCWNDYTPSCFYDKNNDGIIDAYN